jgi:hypothetical protein
MPWPCQRKELAVKTVILTDNTGAYCEAGCWARDSEAKVGREVWIRWTDESQSNDGRVGATAACKYIVS